MFLKFLKDYIFQDDIWFNFLLPSIGAAESNPLELTVSEDLKNSPFCVFFFHCQVFCAVFRMFQMLIDMSSHVIHSNSSTWKSQYVY